jgi:hypothetical protein
MLFLKQFFFGVRRDVQDHFVDGFTTTLPAPIDFNTWCLELKVSSRYQKKTYL